MPQGAVERIAQLLRDRNHIDAEIASIIKRPMTSGHLGEWLAAQVFGIELEPNAVAPGIDGRFRAGPLAGRSVNVKWYLKREGVLDISQAAEPDYYLVLAGPASAAGSSQGAVRPWCISAVYLFDTRELLAELGRRGVKVGVASSVRAVQWAAAQIYPQPTSSVLPLNADQRRVLDQFAALSPAAVSGEDVG